MPILPGQTYYLIDKDQNRLGDVLVQEVRGELVLGKFRAGPAFSRYEKLFAEQEEAANQLTISIAEDLQTVIDGLGLRLCSADGTETTVLHRVQIMNVDDISFRLAPFRYTGRS